MKRFKNILFISHCEKAIESDATRQVRELALANKARVTFLQVLETSMAVQIGSSLSKRLQDITSLALEHCQSTLEEQLGLPLWEGVKVFGKVVSGNSLVAIIREVLHEGHDLVVKTRSSSEADALDMKLLRKCPCPVWIITGGDQGSRGKIILAAIDSATHRPEAVALNRKILELASSLGQMSDSTTHYVHAWHMENEPMLRGPRLNVTDEEIKEYKRALCKEHRESFHTALKECNIEPAAQTTYLMEGKASDVIAGLVERLPVDTLVMGTVARSGVPGILIGNQAESLLNRVSCTVLAVKPEDFVSPVTA